MTKSPILESRSIPLAELSRYPKNPRRGDVTAIAESLRVNGQYRSVVVNVGTHTGRAFEILAGNHTYDGAKLLGWEELLADLVDVDDESAARIVAVDNRAADLATYDDRELLDLLQSLPDLGGTGYTDANLVEFLTNLSPGFEPDIDGEDPRLDRKSMTKCPECGHEFEPTTYNVRG